MPAAVMLSGKNCPSMLAATIAPRYPATNAWELKASIDCAREIRGTYSMPNVVSLRSCRSATSVGRSGIGKERDGGRAGRQWRQAGRIEGLHAQHDIRLVEGMLRDQGASCFVRRIGQQGGGAGTGLHGHLVTRRTKPAHQLRNHCDTRLAGSLFPGHRDAHVTNLMHPSKSCSRIAL